MYLDTARGRYGQWHIGGCEPWMGCEGGHHCTPGACEGEMAMNDVLRCLKCATGNRPKHLVNCV